MKAFRAFGFDSFKLDGCGAQTDMQLWDDVIKVLYAYVRVLIYMVYCCYIY